MRKRFITKLLLAAVLPLASAQAELVSQTNVNIGLLGTENEAAFFLNLREGMTRSCAYGLIYCPQTAVNCKNFYAMTLTAKATNKPLAEIRYDYDPGSNMCYIRQMMTDW